LRFLALESVGFGGCKDVGVIIRRVPVSEGFWTDIRDLVSSSTASAFGVPIGIDIGSRGGCFGHDVQTHFGRVSVLRGSGERDLHLVSSGAG
jgi:hypothetical protein